MNPAAYRVVRDDRARRLPFDDRLAPPSLPRRLLALAAGVVVTGATWAVVWALSKLIRS